MFVFVDLTWYGLWLYRKGHTLGSYTAVNNILHSANLIFPSYTCVSLSSITDECRLPVPEGFASWNTATQQSKRQS